MLLRSKSIMNDVYFLIILFYNNADIVMFLKIG